MTRSLLVYNLLQLFSYQKFDNQWSSCVRGSHIQLAKAAKQIILLKSAHSWALSEIANPQIP